ncbi:hypothetical protein HK096_009646 [Nowakowskiella sp. JEL0078]|nr:hypothetical protein HK096_009646 [Nowakowskiella sp. JEL0078]
MAQTFDLASVVAIVLAILLLFAIIKKFLLTESFGLRSESVLIPPVTSRSTRYLPNDLPLDWSKHCLFIEDTPTIIFSGEFHYWRLPDQSRWEEVLSLYKAAGLNCIRIYFHWGFHSPEEDVYNFDGFRDIDFLLRICEKLHLFVLAAPGPYICAETQGGGIPGWLLAKKQVRIRHLSATARKKYDPEYSLYCHQWFSAIIPIIRKHQITNQFSNTNQRGCVIAFQIENENFENLFGYPFASGDEMRYLCKSARDLGITVPFFTNDGFEAGSFVMRDDSANKNDRHFGIDLYGFDKYVVFIPASSIFGILFGSEVQKVDTTSLDTISRIKKKSNVFPEWNMKTVASALDGIENKVRGFGGGAAKSPIFIPELQGGWFAHPKTPYGYDYNYRFYGESYTQLIVNTVLSQGVTMFSIYMFYGGTNWFFGTLGDTDVFTSYDYSACIREYGFPSGRLRQLRKSISFWRSFPALAETDKANKTSFRMSLASKHSILSIDDNDHDVLIVLRKTKTETGLVFLRNSKPRENYDIHLKIKYIGILQTLIVPCRIPVKQSFTALLDYVSDTGIHLITSLCPIHLRARLSKNSELWIVQNDNRFSGSMVFAGEVEVESSIGVRASRTIHPTINVTMISFDGSWNGWVKFKIYQNATEYTTLFTLFLSGTNLYTFSPTFEDPFFDLKDQPNNQSLKAINWGSFWSSFNLETRTLENHYMVSRGTCSYFLPLFDSPTPPNGFVRCDQNEDYDDFQGLPFLYRHQLEERHEKIDWSVVTPIWSTDWETRTTQFALLPWIPLQSREKMPKQLTRHFKYSPSQDLLDLGFTSGHVLYRLLFSVTDNVSNVVLRLNVRHRVTVWVNNTRIGGHTTYSLSLFSNGSRMGVDRGGGEISYEISKELLKANEGEVLVDNEVVLLIESWGIQREAFVFDDVRNPRGLLSATIYVKASFFSNWYLLDEMNTGVHFSGMDISGVDVRRFGNFQNSRELHAFAVSGLPDESSEDWTHVASSTDSSKQGSLISFLNTTENGYHDSVIEMNGPERNEGPRWYKGYFTLGVNQYADSTLSVPLCIHLTGTCSAYVWINHTLIARFHGNGDYSQSRFYIPDGLLHRNQIERGNEIMILCYGWSLKELKLQVRITEWRVGAIPSEIMSESDKKLMEEEAWSGNAAEDQMEELEGERYRNVIVKSMW